MTNATPKYAGGNFSRRDLPPSIQYYQTQGIKLKGSGAWRDAVCPFHPE